jgi:hypothetical protein
VDCVVGMVLVAVVVVAAAAAIGVVPVTDQRFYFHTVSLVDPLLMAGVVVGTSDRTGDAEDGLGVVEGLGVMGL